MLSTLENSYYPTLFQKLIANKRESWKEYEWYIFRGLARYNDTDDLELW